MRGVTYRLAPVVIVIRMTVTPIPIRPLRLAVRFSEGTIPSVILLEIPAIGAVFVVIPIVIVLVGTVVDPIAVLIVSTVVSLASVVWRPRRSANR
jgi:hypothetical protein